MFITLIFFIIITFMMLYSADSIKASEAEEYAVLKADIELLQGVVAMMEELKPFGLDHIQ